MKHISSGDNTEFKIWHSLRSRKGIKKHGLCLVQGKQVALEILKSGIAPLQTVLFCSSQKENDFDYDLLNDTSTVTLSADLFNHLSLFSHPEPIFVFEQPEILSQQPNEFMKTEELTCLLPLGDPKNLGAALRSALSFGVNTVYLSEEAAHPFLPEVTKAASGANFQLRLIKTVSLKEFSHHAEKQSIYALEGSSKHSLTSSQLQRNALVVVGEEGQGLRQLTPTFAQKMEKLSIPISNKTESLNAVVALSIFFYEYRKQNPKG